MMNTRKISLWLALGIVISSIIACNGSASATPTPGDSVVENTPSVNAPTAETGSNGNACTNPYLPVVVGATWNYNLTGPIPDTFTHTILSVTDSGFVEQDVFNSGVTRQAEWNCEGGDLIALNPSGGGSANVNAEGVEVNFQTTELSGLTLPAVINPGDTWSQSLTLEGTETINGTVYPASNNLTSNCTAIGIESVTVAAGTFEAMRVDCTTMMDIKMTMDGSDIQNTITLDGSNWYAMNVGLVKTVSIGSGLDSTVELVSYTIP